MTAGLQQVLEQARNLSKEDRITLLLALIEQLTPLMSDAELLTPQLKAELDRRIAEIESSPDDGVPMEEAHRMIRARLGSKAS